MKSCSIFLLLLALLLPHSFLMGEATTPHPKKSVEEIVKLFDEKQKSIKPLVLSQDAVLAKTSVTLAKKDDYSATYKFPADGGTYTYTFWEGWLQQLHFEKSGETPFGAEFYPKTDGKKIIGYVMGSPYSGMLMQWQPDTQKPQDYYEMKDETGAYRKVVWDRNGKVTTDEYSATGNIPWITVEAAPSKEEQEKAQKAWEEKRAKEQAAIKSAEQAQLAESRDEAIARLRKEMDEHPNAPDNFFKEFDIACHYIYKLNRQKGEQPDYVKGKETILHCFEAYPQHANNVEMLQLKSYLGDIYRTTKEMDKAIETYTSVINTDPKSIVVYYPETGVQTGDKAQKGIDFVRRGAIQGLASATHSKGELQN